MKSLLKKLLPQLAFFYSYLRYRLFFMVFISIVVGLLDGLGLAMFLPLLQLVADQNAVASSEQMGNMGFILDAMKGLGVSLTLDVILLAMLLFFILKGVAKWFESYLSVIYLQAFTRKVRVDSIQALSKYSYSAFVHADAGKIQNTLTGEVLRITQSFRAYSYMLQHLVLVMVYAIWAIFSNPQFAILVILGGVLTNFLFSPFYKKTKRLSTALTKRNHLFQGLIIQNVAFFKYLKATAQISKYKSFLIREAILIEKNIRKMGALNSIMLGAREPLLIIIIVSVIWIQVNFIQGNLGSIILSLLFFYRGLNSVIHVQTDFNRFLSYSGSLQNIKEFMQELRFNKESNGKERMHDLRQSIVLNNVALTFPDSNKEVLKNISLTIPKNITLAIIGESGSGKTTLMNIIGGLISPSSGEVLIDGKNLKDLDKRSYQTRVGYITQEPIVFDDSIFNNVTFWDHKSETNLQRFHNAVQLADILDFVNELEEKENTRLGNNGINLSGGQKQRISIARELYKEIDLLLLDEATSALDSETELTIQRNIDQLKGKYTIVIIAHRLSTIKNADWVVFLKDGSIASFGSYSKLINQSNDFKSMVDLQSL